MPDHSLVEVNDSVLVVIDVQDAFLEKLPADEASRLSSRVEWLIRVANRLDVPVIVTAEDIQEMGTASPSILEVVPPGTHVFDKMVFGLASDPEILGGIEATGRETTILVGLETDVCITHSALGLLERGYRVVVVADATGSPGTAHSFGLERMRSAGVILSSVKGIFYEWLRTVPAAKAFEAECGGEITPPEGISL